MKRYTQELDALIRDAAQREVQVIIVQPSNRYRLLGTVPNATWDPYFEAQIRVANHREVPIFDVATYLRFFAMPAEEAFVDELHPSGVANALIADGILLMLQSKGWPQNMALPNALAPVIQAEHKDPFEKGVSFSSNTGQDIQESGK